MKIKFLFPSLILALTLVSSCARRKTEIGPGSWTLDNNQLSKLEDYKGKVVVLDFYATWCEPCRDETPRLVELQRQYGENGLQIVGLNVGGEDDRIEVPNYAKEFGVQYPLGYPDDDLVLRYLSDEQSIPQSFVFDRSGRLVKRFIGYTEKSGTELENVVKITLDSPTR